MYENFYGLDIEKRNRIINVALEEFATKGYQKASTNEIVKKAEISKGALFHYFKTKKDLYFFLYRYSCETMKDHFFSKVNTKTRDPIERCSQISLLKLQVVAVYPLIFSFMLNVLKEETEEIAKLIHTETATMIQDNLQELFLDIDTALFCEGIDPQCAINMIMWTLEGFMGHIQRTLDYKQIENQEYLEKIIGEQEVYLRVLKKALYQ